MQNSRIKTQNLRWISIANVRSRPLTPHTSHRQCGTAGVASTMISSAPQKGSSVSVKHLPLQWVEPKQGTQHFVLWWKNVPRSGRVSGSKGRDLVFPPSIKAVTVCLLFPGFCFASSPPEWGWKCVENYNKTSWSPSSVLKCTTAPSAGRCL